MDILTLFICAALLGAAYLFLALGIESTRRSKLAELKFELEKYKIDMGVDINQSTFNLLDSIIDIKWQDTLANNIDLLAPGTFINSKLETDLRTELNNRVKHAMTEHVYRRLLLVYSEDYLNTAISEKVYNIVENFKLTTNNTQVESVNKK